MNAINGLEVSRLLAVLDGCRSKLDVLLGLPADPSDLQGVSYAVEPKIAKLLTFLVSCLPAAVTRVSSSLSHRGISPLSYVRLN